MYEHACRRCISTSQRLQLADKEACSHLLTYALTVWWWLCRNEDAYAASKRLLKMTGVKLRQHQFDMPIVFSLGT